MDSLSVNKRYAVGPVVRQQRGVAQYSNLQPRLPTVPVFDGHKEEKKKGWLGQKDTVSDRNNKKIITNIHTLMYYKYATTRPSALLQ